MIGGKNEEEGRKWKDKVYAPSTLACSGRAHLPHSHAEQQSDSVS